MWPPRSPCGENQVLGYSTVRYLLYETLHYVSSFLLLVYRYLPLDVQVMSSTSLQVGSVDTVPRRCPPSHRKPAYFPSFPQRHPFLSLSLSYTIQSAPYNIPQVGTYLGNTRQDEQSDWAGSPLSPSSAKRYKQPSSNKLPCALMCSTRYLGTGNS